METEPILKLLLKVRDEWIFQGQPDEEIAIINYMIEVMKGGSNGHKR